MKYIIIKIGQIFLPVLVIGITIILGFQRSDSKDYFEIDGKFIGKNTKEIILVYEDEQQNTIIDTLQIESDGSFSAKGVIKGFSSANIKGNVTSLSVEDPNYIHLFLEPGINKIRLEEDHFKNIDIANNRSFTLYKNLRSSLDSIYSVNNWKKIVKQRNSYFADHLVFPGDESLKDSLDYFNNEIDKVVNKINGKKRAFILKHPNDLVSL